MMEKPLNDKGSAVFSIIGDFCAALWNYLRGRWFSKNGNHFVLGHLKNRKNRSGISDGKSGGPICLIFI